VTERKLADRIPVLMQELPYLAEKSRHVAPIVGLSQTSYFTLLGRQVSSFFSSRFAPAVSLGTLALVGGLTWYMLASNGKQSETAHAPAVERAGSSQLNAAPSVDMSAAVDVTAQHDAAAQSATSKLSHQLRDGFKSENGIEHIVHDGKRYPIPRPEAADDLASPDLTDGSAETQNSLDNNDENANAGNGSNADLGKRDMGKTDIGKTDLSKTESQSVDQKSNDDNSAERSNAKNVDPNAAKQQDIRDPEELTPPPVLNKPTITGRVVAQFDVSAGTTVRPNPKSQQYEAGSADVFPNLGIGYEFENGLVLGVEAGRSVLSQHQQEVEYAQPVGGQGPMGSPISVNRRVNYTASVVDVDAYWSQATVRYTVNPGSVLPIEFTAGAGMAFVDGVSPLISLGMGSHLDLTESIALVGGVSMRGAWLDGLNAEQGSNELVGNGEAIGVTHTATTEQVFSSSLSARVGFRYGF